MKKLLKNLINYLWVYIKKGENKMIKLNNLNPFGKLCVTLGMIPSSYKESMTYEEQLLWMFNYLENTLIPKINEQVDAINSQTDYINNAVETQNAEIEEQYETLTGLFNQLKDYVDDYFDNLDVQEEINNKLDEMVEDGTFDVIFAQVDAKIGDLSSLTTTDKSSIVAGVNEVKSEADTNASNIGTLSNLTTDSKTNVVSAINEVDSHADTNASNIGTLSNLTTSNKTDLVNAISEVDSHADTNASAIGTMSSLTTTDKSSLVASNNEIVSRSTTAINKLGVIYDTSYSSISQTGNYVLEHGVSGISGSIHYTSLLENLSLTFNLDSNFTLTGGSSQLLATLYQPEGRTIQGGHGVALLSNGEACDCIIIGGATISIYIKSPNSYSSGQLSTVIISNLVTFNLLANVVF